MAERKEEYFQARDIYLVNISIIRAINLAKADTFGKSDGFVKVECLNRKFRTVTIKNNLDPTWDARTQFQFFRKPMQIKFRVLDWNSPPQKDKPLGHIILDIPDEYWLKGNPGFSKQIVDLTQCKRGQIEVSFSCSKLEPFSYLDRMRTCAEQKIQYKKEMDICQQNITNTNDTYIQTQQACAAYEQKCNQLEEEYADLKQEKATCKEQGRKCDSEAQSLKEECSEAESLYNNLTKEYQNKDYECNQIIKEYSKIKKECQNLQNASQQLQQQYQQKQQQAYEQQQQYEAQEDNIYESKEPINEYEVQEDGEYDDEKMDILKRIKEYIINVGKNDTECDVYDGELCGDIIIKYKEQYDIYQSGVMGDDDMDENEGYLEARDEGNKYLNEIKKWSQGCNEEIYRKMERSVDELDYSDVNQKQFFTDMYVQLNKFFFCLGIVEATLQCFGDDILKVAKKKKINKITFNDLAGNVDGWDTKNDSYDEEEDEATTVWRTLYEDLDFVIKELGDILDKYMRTKPILDICRLQSDFISSCYDGNYTLFSKLISHYMCQYIVEEILDDDDNPNALLDDAMIGTIQVLNDKKAFVNKLYQSMKDNEPIPKDNEEEEEDEYDDTIEIPDKYEQIVSIIIACVCKLDCLGGVTKLDANDKKKIKEKLKIVLEKCDEYNVDAKSQSLIEKFFGYFFVPESSGGLCDCSGDNGGFFGSLFGSLCK